MSTFDVTLANAAGGQPKIDSLHEVSTLQEKNKLQTGNGYSHFTYSGETVAFQDRSIPVFRECGRTKIAE